MRGDRCGPRLPCDHQRGQVQHHADVDQAVADMVRAYTESLGVQIAAHDLRRTFGKLVLQGDARIEQISLSLGTPVSRRALGSGIPGPGRPWTDPDSSLRRWLRILPVASLRVPSLVLPVVSEPGLLAAEVFTQGCTPSAN